MASNALRHIQRIVGYGVLGRYLIFGSLKAVERFSFEAILCLCDLV